MKKCKAQDESRKVKLKDQAEAWVSQGQGKERGDGRRMKEKGAARVGVEKM